MPNWCSANYTFYAKTDIGKKNLQSFWQKLNKIFNDKDASHGVKSIVKKLGVTDTILYDIGSDPRDSIEDVQDVIVKTDKDWHFEIQAELAWSDYYTTRALHYLITRMYSEVKMAFIAEECGEEYYVKCDPKGFYKDKYIVDISGTHAPTEGTTYLVSKEGLIAFAEEFGVKRLGKNSTLKKIQCKLWEQLIIEAQERGEETSDIAVNIHEFDEVSYAKDYHVENVEAA